jgi:hypothetical protein
VKRVQVRFAVQLDEPLQVLLAPALLSLGPFPEIAIVRL